MSITLNKPEEGNTNWWSAITTNWNTLEAAINNSGADVADAGLCQGRLSAVTGVAVSTDQSSSGTLYFVPYKGNRISLYDGSIWKLYTFSQRSKSLSGIVSSGSNYDVFAYLDSDDIELELSAAWNSNTARFSSGTYQVNLPFQDGVPVKSTNGSTIDATRRYLGTIRGSGTSTIADSATQRFLWNYYNRVTRSLSYTPSGTTQWTMATTNWRYANSSSSHRVETVRGVDEDTVYLQNSCLTVGSAAQNAALGIGSGSTTNIAQRFGHTNVTHQQLAYCTYSGMPGIGYREFNMLESQSDSNTTTYYYGGVSVGSENWKHGLIWYSTMLNG